MVFSFSYFLISFPLSWSFPSIFQVFSIIKKAHERRAATAEEETSVATLTGTLAQQAEQLAVNQWVIGSNPIGPVQETKFLYNNSE